MNSLRIMIIPIAEIMFGLDLKEGIRHELLGYGVMLMACAMLLSTDQLMEYLFGKKGIDDGAERPRWGGLGSRRSRDDDRIVRRPVSSLFRRTILVGAAVMVILGCFQISDVVRSLNNPEYRVRFFDNSTIIDVEPDCMPQVVRSSDGTTEYQWDLIQHERSDRTRGSDLGQRSDQWMYGSKTGVGAFVHLDQPFPGWHELTTCYKNMGWEFASLRRRLSEPLDLGNGETMEWTYIEVELQHPATLQRGFLLFCFCDGNGQPFDAPVEWDQLSSLFERAKNRLSYRIRSNLFRGQSYQIQVFSPAADAVTDQQKDECRSQFFEVRKLLRNALLRYRDADIQQDAS